MRAAAQAILPILLAVFAFILIVTFWDRTDSTGFAAAAAVRAERLRAAGAGFEGLSLPGSGLQSLLRGRLLDEVSGEPFSARVTVLGSRGNEFQADAGADGVFQVGCPSAERVTLVIPRTENHFGLVEDLDPGSASSSRAFKLAPRRDLPVILRTPDGRALAEVVPPAGPWARETWPSILITQSAPASRSSEGGLDPLRATRMGQFLSTVHGDVAVRPGSPDRCAGYVRLLRAPPVCCSLVIGSRVLQTIEVDAGDRLVSFTVDPSELENVRADIQLRVVDESTGRAPGPRSGLWLGVLDSQARELDPELDGEGRVLIRDVPAGSVELQLRLTGFEHQEQRFDLRAGELNDLGELRVHAAACVAGHIVSESGEPIRARVWSSSPEGRDHALGAVVDVPEGADWFAVLGLPRTSMLVGIDDPRFALNPIEVDLGSGSVQNARIVAREGALLRLVGPSSAAGTASLRVLDARRVCVWSAANLEVELHELRLLPGLYTVEVAREGTPAARREIDLSSGHDATIRLR